MLTVPILFFVKQFNLPKNCSLLYKMAENSLVEKRRLCARINSMEAQLKHFKTELDDIKTAFAKFANDSPEENPAKRAKIDESNTHGFNMKDGYVVAYTDGACENNGQLNAKAGIGVWFGHNHPLNLSEPVKGKATNNAGEIQACIAAVKIVKDHGINKLEIITDSQFTINSMTKWIKGWKRNAWKLANNKGDVKNKKDFQELDKLCQGMDVVWTHVAGHAGIEGNENADKLAREGARRYKQQ